MRNRYYDPEIGRFISADPMGYLDGPSLYQYGVNDPFNNSDPLGLLKIQLRRAAADYGPATYTVGFETRLFLAAQHGDAVIGPGATRLPKWILRLLKAWKRFKKADAYLKGEYAETQPRLLSKWKWAHFEERVLKIFEEEMGQGGIEAPRTFGGYGVYAEKQLDNLQEAIDQAISELEKSLNPSLDEVLSDDYLSDPDEVWTLKYSKEDMLFLRDSYNVDKLKTEADELAKQR